MGNALATGQGGVVTTAEVTEAGFRRESLGDLVNEGKLERYSRGIYTVVDEWPDEMVLLQRRYTRMVFSHETALYLHGLADTAPSRYTVTVPSGYNPRSLADQNLQVYRCNRKLYPLGLTTTVTPYGNGVAAYDRERSLCDLFRGQDVVTEQINFAMREYLDSPEKNLPKLTNYAAKLRVAGRVDTYLRTVL
ncbi:type IV toxin-antitoxin system AbiEi family antitoxin domain-containing protein [Mobiluncus mulieris]|uniref:type IV toxin-antitoxin system AbiEi family antitoxin domain-containing protein n=1 Tax=Mobiluncus mulieris TaxID=2052 RepID=UPI00242E2568|nr:type IV toxin-antitoxin system AbiEi family antitoxin domain-containing protein [Mobiluncus mulieris]